MKNATHTETEKSIGTATYKNTHSGETYEMGFFYDPVTETPLSHAWDIIMGTITIATGWHWSDIKVDSAK